eukprot:7100028-Prymnesium_polylepis.1
MMSDVWSASAHALRPESIRRWPLRKGGAYSAACPGHNRTYRDPRDPNGAALCAAPRPKRCPAAAPTRANRDRMLRTPITHPLPSTPHATNKHDQSIA